MLHIYSNMFKKLFIVFVLINFNLTSSLRTILQTISSKYKFKFYKSYSINLEQNLDDIIFVEKNSIGNKRYLKWDNISLDFKTSLNDIQRPHDTFVTHGLFVSFNEALKSRVTLLYNRILTILSNSFLPVGVLTKDYYKYTSWKILQRFLTSTNSVFGTQSLLLAIGVKQKIGIAAATTWVLKDCLGKFSRIFWASKNGKRFDSDAKRWRYRSSLLYATGNALEIFTYLIPSLFLFSAAIANALKQMAMLTSSSTRNAIYKSFSRNADNIGDITAKGEAQTSVIDILGMFTGISISKLIGVSRVKLLVVFSIFSILDIFAVFNEIKSVVFNTLNYERTGLVLSHLFEGLNFESPSRQLNRATALTPDQVARMEKIFYPSKFGESLFHCFSDIMCDSNKFIKYFSIFGKEEKFIVTIDYKKYNPVHHGFGILTGLNTVGVVRKFKGVKYLYSPQILLHSTASSTDIFRALVVVHRVIHELSLRTDPSDFRNENENVNQNGTTGIIDTMMFEILSKAYDFQKLNFQVILERLNNSGWDTTRFTFGTIMNRIEYLNRQ